MVDKNRDDIDSKFNVLFERMDKLEAENRGDIDSTFNALFERLDKLEAELVEQDHRSIRIVKNLVDYGRSKNEKDRKLRKASWVAFLRMLFMPTGAKIAGGGTIILAIVSITIAVWANQISINQLLLEESNRRATLAVEITSIFDQISEHYVREGPLKPIPKHIVARFISISQVLKPYRYLNLESTRVKVTDRPYSPEKGQLFMALLEVQPTNIREIFGRMSFAFMDLPSIRIASLPAMDNLNFRGSNLSQAQFVDDTLRGARFDNVLLTGAEISGCIFYGSIFTHADLRQIEISETDMSGADFHGADLRGLQVNDNLSSFEGANLEGAIIDMHTWQTVFAPRGFSPKDVIFKRLE